METIKKISIIIPVYNEKNTILEILKKIEEVKLDLEKEIIIVDDGSNASTRELLKNLKKDDYVIIFKEKNEGKGSAIKTGLAQATGELVLFQDADLEYDPKDIPSLLKALEDLNCDVVYGSRNLAPIRKGYTHYTWGAALLTKLVNLFYGSALTDVYTGYKLFRSSVLKSLPLKSTRFEIEMELTVQLLKKGFAIREVAISYFPRSFAEGKKIRVRDGIKGLWLLLHSLLQGK